MIARTFSGLLTKLSPHFIELSQYKGAIAQSEAGNWEGSRSQLKECFDILSSTGQADKTLEAACTAYK